MFSRKLIADKSPLMPWLGRLYTVQYVDICVLKLYTTDRGLGRERGIIWRRGCIPTLIYRTHRRFTLIEQSVLNYQVANIYIFGYSEHIITEICDRYTINILAHCTEGREWVRLKNSHTLHWLPHPFMFTVTPVSTSSPSMAHIPCRKLVQYNDNNM